MAGSTGSNNIIRPLSLFLSLATIWLHFQTDSFLKWYQKNNSQPQITMVHRLRKKETPLWWGCESLRKDAHSSSLRPHAHHRVKHSGCRMVFHTQGLDSLTTSEGADRWERRFHPTQTTSTNVNRCKATRSWHICLVPSPTYHSASCRNSALSLGIHSH